MNDCKKVDFEVFLEQWNQEQNYTTPSMHLKMATWLQTSWELGKTRLLLMAFRASGKSTLAGLFSAWILYRDPECRILVLAAEFSLAKKMVRNIKRVIERHPLTRHLKPTKIDQWAADRFTIERDKELRDPSVLARGITSNITGSRADIIICDDVEVPNTCDTAEKRNDLRERLSEINYILVPEGMQIYIGTPHSWYSIYANEPRTEVGEEEIFLKDFDRLLIPVLDEKEESAWPERYPREKIDQIKQQTGPNKFASQMMLQPMNIAEGRLDPALLQVYDEELVYSEANKYAQLHLCGRRLVSCSAWWDPAFGRRGGDSSVLAIVYTDDVGNYYLHRLAYLKADNIDTDEATWQCRQVANLLEKFYVPSVVLETNGIGKFLPGILRRQLSQIDCGAAVREKSNSKSKDLRILESFDAVMAAQSLYVHKNVYATPFINEMQDWWSGNKKAHDDGLDAVAGALSEEPVRLKRVYPAKVHQSWSRGQQTYQAKTDF